MQLRSNALTSIASCSLLLVLGTFAACGSDDESNPSDDDGVTDGSGGSGGSGEGGGPSSSGSGGSSARSSSSGSGGAVCMGLGDACSDCAFTSCSQLYCACYDNPTCGALVACAQGCASGDTGCAQSCLTQNQAGISDALLLGNCAAQGCATQCPTAAMLQPCESCAFANCPQQMNACLANPECTALIECAQGCGDDDLCLYGCALDHGDGQDDAEAVQNCVESPCPECG